MKRTKYGLSTTDWVQKRPTAGTVKDVDHYLCLKEQWVFYKDLLREVQEQYGIFVAALSEAKPNSPEERAYQMSVEALALQMKGVAKEVEALDTTMKFYEDTYLGGIRD